MILTGDNSTYDDEDTEYDTEHDVRKRAMLANDIVHCISLRDYFQEKISNWRVGVGETFYTEVMTNVDIETANGLKEYVTL